MIVPPFANYHRAKLERLVREGFERIEAAAAQNVTQMGWTSQMSAPMHAVEFQLLVAADAYLRSLGKP